MSRLVQNRVMGHKDLRSLTKYQLILARDQFRKNPPSHLKACNDCVPLWYLSAVICNFT